MVYWQNVLYQVTIIIGLLPVCLPFQNCQQETENTYQCMEQYYNPCRRSGYHLITIYKCSLRKSLNLLSYFQSASPYINLQDQPYLNFYNGNLHEITPSSFRSFTNLKHLSLGENNISFLEAGAFSGLPQLQFLNLRHNSIHTIQKGVFNAMFNLKLLDLSHNNIETIDNNSLAGTDLLEVLFLNDNKISNMSSLADNCQRLLFIDISNNEIEDLEFIKSSLNLTTLNAANNKISIFPLDTLSLSITSLDLSENKLVNIDSHDFVNLVKLQRLNLSSNHLFEDNEISIDLFRNTKFLRALNLSSTSIKKLNVGTFSQLRLLEVLDLSSNNITFLPNGIFHDLQQLRELYISSNSLSYFEYDGFSTLSVIDLNDNLWNCDSLSVILKNARSDRVIRGNAYDETNIRGIACYEALKDFQKVDSYNSSDFNSLQKEYLSHIIQTQVDMRDTFSQLKHFLNQTNQNQQNYSEYNLSLELKNFLNATNLIQKAMQAQQSSIDSTLMSNILEQRNYSADYWNKFETMHSKLLQTLQGIEDNLVAINTQSQVQTRTKVFTTQTQPLKTYEGASTNRSDTAALYCIFLLLLAMFALLVLVQFRKYRNHKRNHEETPLNSLEILR